MSSTNVPDPVLDRARIREVTGVFFSREDLDAAVSQLLLAGFDRADVDVLDSARAIRERVGGAYIAHEELADVPGAPRAPFLGWDDVTHLNVTFAAIVGAAIAMGAAYFVLTSGGTSGQAFVSAALLGIIACGVSFFVAA